jgi:hypothetical protein
MPELPHFLNERELFEPKVGLIPISPTWNNAGSKGVGQPRSCGKNWSRAGFLGDICWSIAGSRHNEKSASQSNPTLSFLHQHAEVHRAYDLAQPLLTMVAERNAAPLESWVLRCSNSGVRELENFARGLQKEFSALQAALTLKYRNGAVEGHITKLKLIKRSMYGRGSFTLLRQRVLKAA